MAKAQKLPLNETPEAAVVRAYEDAKRIAPEAVSVMRENLKNRDARVSGKAAHDIIWGLLKLAKVVKIETKE